MVASEVMKAMRRVERAVARRASYEEVMGALDTCAALPDADQVHEAIQSWRVTAAIHDERPAAECEAALAHFLDAKPPLDRRASKLLAVCATHPELARRYLPTLVAELEAAPHDETIAQILSAARKIRERHQLEQDSR